MVVIASVAPEQNNSIIHSSLLMIPVIDLSWKRDQVAELMVKACEDFGFFKVINHGVPEKLTAELEAEAMTFFSLPTQGKQKVAVAAGLANPLGYGSRNIGFKGDMGELEYLLLHCNPSLVSQKMKSTQDADMFSSVLNEYVEEVRELACEILQLLGEGLGLEDSGVLSSLIKDTESDSLIRLNHYPPPSINNDCNCNCTYCLDIGCDEEEGKKVSTDHGWNRSQQQSCLKSNGHNQHQQQHKSCCRIGFGEHSDPQIVSILRSNDVQGLQVLVSSASSSVPAAKEDSSIWVPVPPDPAAFYVNVGDVLQALTNGRLVSARHRAMANCSNKSRLSILFFGAPALHTRISPLPEMVTPQVPRRYKLFTWAEYKKAMYSLRLGHDRLQLFRA